MLPKTASSVLIPVAILRIGKLSFELVLEFICYDMQHSIPVVALLFGEGIGTRHTMLVAINPIVIHKAGPKPVDNSEYEPDYVGKSGPGAVDNGVTCLPTASFPIRSA